MSQTSKTCTRCKKKKDESEFHYTDKTRGRRAPHCKKCQSERNAEWRRKNPERKKELGRKNQRDALTRLRHEMVEAYGGHCECCGEAEMHFLTLDHRFGVPDHHKTASGKRISGLALLRKIKKEGYPPEYRVLCWNCNASHGFYGFCPHQPHELSQRRY